jgi:ABC-type transport system substrate-binding protein
MGLATWCADWPGLGGRGMLAPLVGSAGVAPRGATNYAGLASPPDLDRALAAAETEPDPAVAAARWREADAAAVALAAVVPIAHLAEPSLLGPRVRGWVAHPAFVRGDLTALWLAGP